MSHTTQIVVRSDDIDISGHVRNSKYIDYAGHARWIALAAAGADFSRLFESKISPIDLESSITFMRELVLGDTADIHTRFEFPSAKTVRVVQTMSRSSDGTVSAEVVSMTGVMDLTTRKLVPDAAAVWRDLVRVPAVVDLPAV